MKPLVFIALTLFQFAIFLVSSEKPQKQAVRDFIEWTLTEGQQYVEEAGYVLIGQDEIDGYLQKLK